MVLINNILIVCLSIISTIFLTNFIIINNLPLNFPIPNIFILIIIISTVSFALGYGISIKAQKENCNRSIKAYAFKQGIKSLLYAIVSYLVIYFITPIRSPFLEIFGNGPLGFSIAQSFMISLNLVIATIINYFNSIKIACKVPQQDIEKNLKKLDKYLKKKFKKKKKRLITIRN